MSKKQWFEDSNNPSIRDRVEAYRTHQQFERMCAPARARIDNHSPVRVARVGKSFQSSYKQGYIEKQNIFLIEYLRKQMCREPKYYTKEVVEKPKIARKRTSTKYGLNQHTQQPDLAEVKVLYQNATLKERIRNMKSYYTGSRTLKREKSRSKSKLYDLTKNIHFEVPLHQQNVSSKVDSNVVGGVDSTKVANRIFQMNYRGNVPLCDVPICTPVETSLPKNMSDSNHMRNTEETSRMYSCNTSIIVDPMDRLRTKRALQTKAMRGKSVAERNTSTLHQRAFSGYITSEPPLVKHEEEYYHTIEAQKKEGTQHNPLKLPQMKKLVSTFNTIAEETRHTAVAMRQNQWIPHKNEELKRNKTGQVYLRPAKNSRECRPEPSEQQSGDTCACCAGAVCGLDTQQAERQVLEEQQRKLEEYSDDDDDVMNNSNNTVVDVEHNNSNKKKNILVEIHTNNTLTLTKPSNAVLVSKPCKLLVPKRPSTANPSTKNMREYLIYPHQRKFVKSISNDTLTLLEENHQAAKENLKHTLKQSHNPTKRLSIIEKQLLREQSRSIQ